MGKIFFKIILFVLIVPFVGFAGECADARSMKIKARSALFSAQKKIEKGSKDEALKVLLDFIKENPDDNHPFVPYTAAGIYLERKEISRAVKMYELCVSLCPSYVPALQNLGALYFELKEYEKSAKAFESAWNYEGRKKPQLLFGAALARLNSKDSSKALAHLFTLSEIKNPDPKWVKLMVNTAIELKMQKKALKIVEKHMEKGTKEAYLFRSSASLYLSHENYLKAAENLSSYSKLEELSKADKKLLADLYNSIGVPSKAASIYEKLKESDAGEKIFIRLVKSNFNACYFDKAVSAALEGIKKYPESYELWKYLGWAQFEKKNYQKASKAFSMANSINKEDLRSLFMLGLCASKAGLKTTAVKALKEVSLNSEYKRKAKRLLKSINSEA